MALTSEQIDTLTLDELRVEIAIECGWVLTEWPAEYDALFYDQHPAPFKSLTPPSHTNILRVNCSGSNFMECAGVLLRVDCPNYPLDIVAAWSLVEVLIAAGRRCEVKIDSFGSTCKIYPSAGNSAIMSFARVRNIVPTDNRAPETICRAFLKAVNHHGG